MHPDRQAVYARGPRFFLEGEAEMYEFRIDATNRIGPFPATHLEREEHADAYARFQAAQDEPEVQLQIATTGEPEHASDCAIHDGPADEPGACDCGAIPPAPERQIDPEKRDEGLQTLEQKVAPAKAPAHRRKP